MTRQDLIAVRNRCDMILAVCKAPADVLEVVNDIVESEKVEIFTQTQATKMIQYVNDNRLEIVAYRNNGMKIADISNLIACLA